MKQFRPAIKRESFIAHVRLESGELLVLEYPSRLARFLDLGSNRLWIRTRVSERSFMEPLK